MKINTKKKIQLFDGKVIKTPDGDLTVGEAIASILVEAKAGGKMKTYILAQNFYLNEKDSFELDKADFNLVRDLVDKTDIYNNLICGQILIYLDSLKEKEEKKDLKSPKDNK